nr:phosphatidylinositol/phosphatidylcholine transfer protein SFH12-like [Ipomoea batatas]
MGDDSAESYSHPTQRSNAKIMSSKNRLPRSYLVATASEHFAAKALNCITSVKKCVHSSGAVGNVVEFLITTAALEIVRRFSRSKCPLIWQGLQALQVICYPPFKWLQRWFPFKPLAKEMRVGFAS